VGPLGALPGTKYINTRGRNSKKHFLEAAQGAESPNKKQTCV